MITPFNQGRAAARAGELFGVCPIPKPDRPEGGDNYPGDWVCWMHGWINQRSMMMDTPDPDPELHKACVQVSEFMGPFLKPGVRL